MPTGYVLPIQPANAPARAGWLSEIWPLRRGRLFLIPGDSPIGFRLPLDSLPYLAAVGPTASPARSIRSRRAGELPHPDILFQRAHERLAGATAQTGTTRPRRRRRRAQGSRRRRAGPHRAHRRAARRPFVRLRAAGRAARGLSRARRRHRSDRSRSRDADPDRRLWAALRSAHQRHQGHPRSRRDRGQHPSRRALAARRSTSPAALYEEARLTRLGTDKFMIDGRHTGTGGGNHVVLGGATAADSPFLRRPDLLEEHRALLAAPPVAVLPVLRPVHRPDQPGAAHRRGAAGHASTSARSRSAWCRSRGIAAPLPWLVDRLFRNLLVDVTGNTHRAEICIDKLYSPDGPTGRLGLVEFRSFEMPPDARMSLAQQLLLRALDRPVLARAARRARWCAGAPRCTTASCCEHFVWAGLPRSARRARAAKATASIRNGSTPSANSAFRSTARSITAACGSSCATRWSRGT